LLQTETAMRQTTCAKGFEIMHLHCSVAIAVGAGTGLEWSCEDVTKWSGIFPKIQIIFTCEIKV